MYKDEIMDDLNDFFESREIPQDMQERIDELDAELGWQH